MSERFEQRCRERRTLDAVLAHRFIANDARSVDAKGRNDEGDTSVDEAFDDLDDVIGGARGDGKDRGGEHCNSVS